MRYNFRTAISVLARCILILSLSSTVVSAAEPELSDYTSTPIFTVNKVKPNILILLDNSGSMNHNAYGSSVSEGGIVNDQPYQGTPYLQTSTYKISTGADDAEEQLSNGATGIANGSNDLDLGRYWGGDDSSTVIGLRFQGVSIPENATIRKAWIEFTVQRKTSSGEDEDILLEIVGQDSDNAQEFTNSRYNISSTATRPETNAVVEWGSATIPSMDPWDTVNDTKATPDLKAIINEILSRDGWQNGNSIVFKFRYKTYSKNAKRDAWSYNGSSDKAPVLKIQFDLKDKVGVRYYGYFNPDWFYKYTSSKFKHKYKKVGYNKDKNCWNVIYPSSYADPGEESKWSGKKCLSDSDITNEELWDGNWMNWSSMRRIDIARKVMMGGLLTSRQGGGNQVNHGENPKQKYRTYKRYFDSSEGTAVTPYSSSSQKRMYGFKGGQIYVDTDYDNNPFENRDDNYDLAIDKNFAFDEADFDSEGKVSGFMQKYWKEAYWGNEFFYEGEGKNEQGGYISNRIGSNDESIITDLENTGADTWTPLAEAYYVAMQYFKQEDPDGNLGYHSSAIGATNNTNDPLCRKGEFTNCPKNFVIILTDGLSTKDAKIPTILKDYDQDNNDKTACNESNNSNCDFSSGGTDFLDDVALYARTTDLRDDLDGEQNLILYTVYAFGNDNNARQLLMDASRNGGFDDLNGNNKPDGDYTSSPSERLEWDENGDGIPDTYFEAQDGYKLEKELEKAINDILDRASSGTAISVLATSSEGEGQLTQAYFRPIIRKGSDEIKWAGYLQSLWVDTKGFIREDSNQNQQLDLDEDNILKFLVNASGDTVVNKYDVSLPKCYSTNSKYTDEEACKDVDATGKSLPYSPPNSDCKCIADIYPDISYICKSTDPLLEDNVACKGITGESLGTFNDGECLCTSTPAPTQTVNLEGVKPIWEAGSALAEITDPDGILEKRNIFTSIDSNSAVSLFGGTAFTTNNANYLQPFFGVKDDTAWSYLGESQNDRTNNLIRYIRGFDSGFSGKTDLRNRTIDVKGTKRVWRLGDIVHSTPVTVSAPLDNYGLIYKDEGYQQYYSLYDDRESVVYVGANDGMLHAFTSWKYNTNYNKFERISNTDTKPIGGELWAYIPQSLLPHLKWLPQKDYQHVYYVDLKPRVVDANIFTEESDCNTSPVGPNCVHPNGWGTILIGGLRFGGKPINVTDDFDYNSITIDTTREFTSSYFAIDITNPRNPKVLWDKSYSGLGFTTSRPGIIRVDDEWMLVFGSGPTEFGGVSNQQSKIFVVDLKTGESLSDTSEDWIFELPEENSFMGGVVSLDYGLNYNVDSIYLGQTYDARKNISQDHEWKGSLYRITVPWSCGDKCDSKAYGTTQSYDTDHDSIDDCSCNYKNDPNEWKIGKLFDSPKAITMEPSLSVDFNGSIFAYFGTGRFLSQEDKHTVDPQFLYGIKDPFFNFKHSSKGNDTNYHYADNVSGDDNYYHNSNATLTLEPDDLFPADIYNLIYPWGYYEAPAGNCSSVPVGQIGDIYEDGSCIASYDWPAYSCTPTASTPTESEINSCNNLSSPGLGVNYAGDATECYCTNYIEPVWGCIEKNVGGCLNVPEGVVHEATDYSSFFWRKTELTENGCSTVPFGDVVSTTDCITEVVSPPAWQYWERPAGDCTAAGVSRGDEGDISEDGGSCFAGYWTCTEQVANGCDTVDYKNTTGFLGTNGDGDINGDKSCLCEFTDEPVARIDSTNSYANLDFSQIVKIARKYEGWVRALPEPGERAIEKPAVLGGISFFPTYVPNDDECSFGGESYLYSLYFESGTAYQRSIFSAGAKYTIENGKISLPEKIKLGTGMASSPSIHVGQQDGNKAKIFTEQSTGVIKDIEIDPAFKIRSGLQYWQQK